MSTNAGFIKERVVHYGTLAEAERRRLAAAASAGKQKGGRDAKGIMGHINSTNEIVNLDETGLTAQQQELLKEFEKRKKARQIQVSTDDGEVKAMLRKLGEPICLFGEGPADRRERLRMILSEKGAEAIRKHDKEMQENAKPKPKEEKVTWYHEGSDALQAAREWIALYSLPRARERIALARKELDVTKTQKDARAQEVAKRTRALANYCSQIGDDRPISYCDFSPDGNMLATASWSGLCKLWSVPGCELIRTLRGHKVNAGCITFHPQATVSLDDTAPCLASCSQDGAVKLWNLVSDEPIADLEGLEPHRVSRVKYHPSGRFLAACVFDHSWRLWDLEVGEEVLHQEGHAAPVYDIGFQCDGSLALTGGLDSYGRLWDLRTGRCVMFLDGHLQGIMSVDLCSNGFQAATASQDNTVKMWDLRTRTSVYSLPAHTSMVSAVRFEPGSGDFIITASYDNSVKIWSHPVWAPLKTLSGHEGKVMGLAISPDSKYIATSSFDRTFKIWTQET